MIPAAVYLALPYVLAVLLALAIPLGTVMQYRLVRAVSPDTRVIVLLVLIAFGAIVSVALTPRTLNERDLETAGRQLMSDFEEGFAASRYLNMLIVGAGFVELLRGWLQSRARAEPDPARPILWGLVAFYLGTILIQAFGSAHPGFGYQSLYVPVVLLTAYYQRITRLARIVEVAKICILVLMVSSLAAIAVKPDFVLHRPDPGVLPGIDFRLFGLTPHANALGPMALIGLMLEAWFPTRQLPLRVLHVVAAAAVLVLAQSKTAWVASLVILLVVTVPLGLRPAGDASDPRAGFGRAVVTLLACIAVLIVLFVGLAQLDVVGYLDRTAQIETLTGRTQIWDITLQAWHESYLFGYGREIWGAERMLKFRLFHVGQAHNQFVQTLGEAGLLGLTLLLAYLGVLLHAALSRFAASRGVVLALVVLVFARCITEAPLRVDGVQSWPTFTNVLLIVFACHFLRGGGLAQVSRERATRGARSGALAWGWSAR
jgi:O-antigen ligase